MIPSYRHDLNEEIDLTEEVARIYGYNNIEKNIPSCSISTIPNDPVFIFENEMRNRLAGLGLTEFLSCDLMSPFLADIAKEINPRLFDALKAVYSKSEEFSILRTSLLPNLLQVAKGNFAQKNKSFAAFEIGRIHFLQNKKVEEIPMAAVLLTGKKDPSHWSLKNVDVDFFDLKGILENLFDATYSPSQHSAFHPGRQADLQMGDLIVGSLGEIHPRLLAKFDIEQPIYYAEINLMHLLNKKTRHLKMKPLSQFPSSERDWTLPLEAKMPIETIFAIVHAQKSALLEKVELIDLYSPEHQKVKNATFRFVYRDQFKTISFDEVEAEHANIVRAVSEKIGKI